MLAWNTDIKARMLMIMMITILNNELLNCVGFVYKSTNDEVKISASLYFGKVNALLMIRHNIITDLIRTNEN